MAEATVGVGQNGTRVSFAGWAIAADVEDNSTVVVAVASLGIFASEGKSAKNEAGMAAARASATLIDFCVDASAEAMLKLVEALPIEISTASMKASMTCSQLPRASMELASTLRLPLKPF